MIKKNRNKSLMAVLGGVLAVACVSVGFGVTTVKPANAEIQVPNYYKESYYKGETINLASKKIAYNGKEYDANVVVIAPDGKGYNGESVDLSQVGVYTVEYRFVVDGKVLLTREPLTVLQNLYEVSSARSSVEYTTYTDTVDAQSYTYASGSTWEKPAQTLTSEGVLVDLASGDEFTYNKIIDLKDNTQYDKLLGLFVIPQNKGTADLYKLDVTFTDVYDESNYVTVSFKTGEKSSENLIAGKHYYEYSSYMSANSAQQLTTGIDRNDKGTFEYEGNLYYKWVSHAQYGYMFRTAFYGSNADPRWDVEQATGKVVNSYLEYYPIGAREMEIYFDYESRQIHGAKPSPNPTTLVCDLDDSAFFNDLWKGFTTGEVKMSIRGGNYVSASAKFMITNIDGHDVSAKTLTDDTAPSLTLDMQGYESNALPVAKKGLPYKIFSAQAVDDYDGNREVVANVYYNYNSSAQINVELKDGAFIPEYAGRYAVVYTTSDASGNVTKKTLWVMAESGLALRLDVDELTETATVGQEVRIPNYTVHGESGETTYNVVARHKTQNVVYPVKNGVFVPMYAGDYELVYECSDYVETVTKVINLTVETTDCPTIIDEMELPDYLLKNCIYRLPEVKGYVFEDGKPIEKQPSISVVENGKSRVLPNNYFAPQAAGEVTIRYTVENGDYSYSKDFVVNVVDVGYSERIAMENYFLGDIQTEATSRYVQLTATTEETAYFSTQLQVYEFQSKMQIDSTKNDFETLTVRLQDTVNKDVSLAFRFIKGDKSTQFSVNGDKFTYALGYDAFRSSVESFVLNYYNTTKQVTFDEATFITIEKDENGKPFNGFTGNVAYISYTFENVSGESGLRFYQINGQPFNNGVVDKIEPQLFIVDRDSGLKKIGDKLYIAPSFAFDVLDPNTDLSFAIYDPDGNICISDDGVLLDASADTTRSYLVTAKKMGSYVVRYQVSDTKGNKITDSYALRVVDKEPPVIEVQAPVETAKVGDTVALYQATATDNVTETVTLRMYVYAPDGRMVDITSKTELTLTLRGAYKITYMAFDELKNVSFKTFTIRVS